MNRNPSGGGNTALHRRIGSSVNRNRRGGGRTTLHMHAVIEEISDAESVVKAVPVRSAWGHRNRVGSTDCYNDTAWRCGSAQH